MNLRKRWRTFFGVFVLSILCFTSCDNFLQGTDVKEEITKSIEYNNAPSYAINVEALAGTGTIKTPATGEVTKKVTDTFTIRFEPAENHKFIKWEAVVKGMSTGEKAADYITFEDSESLETKVTFKKASSKTIVLRPVCPENISVKSFNLGESDIAYPKDSSIILTFNKPIAEDCIDSISVSIPGIDEGKDFKDYFKAPKLISEKEVAIYADWDREYGPNYIPVSTNGTKTIAITIPKNKFYYICKDYLEPYKITLNTDLTFTYTISDETSEQTHIKFLVDEDTKGTFRVNDENANELTSKYSVGKSLSLRYKPAEGYFFDKWVIKRTYNENGVNKIDIIPLDELDTINLSFTYPENEENFGIDPLTNVVQAVLTIVNYTSGDITVTPVNKPRQKIQFKQVDDQFGTYKIDDVLCDNQLHEYSIGSSVNLKFKVNDGYRYRGWKVYKIVPNQQGNEGLEELDSNTYSNYLTFTFDDNTVEGYAEETKLATVQLDIKASYNNTLVVKPDVIPIPTAVVTVEGTNGKFSPSKGETTVLQGASIHQMFEPDGDYEFIKWEILDANKNYAAIDNGTYISIEDSKKSDITYTLNNAPAEDENIRLVMRPKILERPQTISTTPMYESSGTYRDVSIMVMFDSDMDESSIYYSQEEIDSLKIKYGLVFDEKSGESDFLMNSTGQYYGYKKTEGDSTVIVFKNIQITNNRTGGSLTQYFEPPVFTDPRTLVIPANKDNPVPASTTVLVVLSKDFNYSEAETKKHVTMREAKKWVYFVNNSTDNVAPEVNLGLMNWRDEKISRKGGNRVIINGKKELKLYITETDNASGIPEFFVLNLLDATNNEIIRTYNIDYTRLDKTYAEFRSSETAGDEIEPKDYKTFSLDTGYMDEDGSLLPDVDALTDGNYNISFVFSDKNNNTATTIRNINDLSESDSEKQLPFCITLDSTSPEINSFTVTNPASANEYEQGKFKLSWTCNDNDYTKAVISYKKHNDDDTSWTDETYNKEDGVTSYTKTITGLDDGTNYDFKAKFYDSSDNITLLDNISKHTVPAQIADTFTATVTGDDKNQIAVTWSKPAGIYDAADIFVYKNYGNETNAPVKYERIATSSNTAVGSEESFTVTGLETATDYTVVIYSYDEEQNIKSSSRTSNHLYTAPCLNQPWSGDVSINTIDIGVEQNDFKDGVLIKIYKGSVYTGDDESVTTVDVDADNTNILFESTPAATITTVDKNKKRVWQDKSLTPGEKYYYMIVPEYHDVQGHPAYIYERTQTAAVNNLHVVANSVTTTSMTIQWDKAAGVFDSYSVVVNGHSYLVDNQNDKEHPEYLITGLEGGKSYSYSVITNAKEGRISNTRYCTSQETTAPYPVPSFALTKQTGSILANITQPENYNSDTHSITWELCTTEDGNYVEASSTKKSNYSYEISLSGFTESAYYVRAKTTYNNKSTVSQSVYFVNADFVVSNLRATAATNTSITLSWNNPDSSFKEIQVLNSSDGVIKTIDKTQTSCTISGLTQGSRYYFKIKLVPEEGNNVTTLPVTSPWVYTNPNGVTNIDTSTSSSYKDRITISWTNPTGSYSSIKILNASDDTVIKTITDGSTSFTHTGLNAGQSMSYKIRVEPVYSYGSSWTSDTYTNSTYPPVVTGVSSTLNSPTSMTVSWTTPSGGTYNSYTLYYRNVTEGETTWKHSVSVNKSLSSTKLTGLTPGCLYYYKIATVSNNTSNNTSETGTYSSRLQPATVTNLNLKTRGTNSLELAWTKPTGNFTKYVLSYKKTSDSSWTTVDITNTSTTSYTLSNLAAATQYNIKIKTNIDGSTAANYNNETSTYTWGTRPYAVSNVKVLGNAGGVIVSWTKPSSTYDYGYVYYQTSTDGSNWTNLTCYSYSNSNTITIPSSSITKDKRYRFVVRNYNSSVSQESDDCTSVVFYSAAPKPSNLSVWSHDGSGYQTIRFWMPGTTTTTSLNVNVYIDGVYDNCTSFTNTSSGTYVYYKLRQKICPTTNTNTSTKKIAVQVYNTRNSGTEASVNPYNTYQNETYSEILEADLTFNPNLRVDGQVIYYSSFVNVITSNTTITGSGSSGAFTSGRTVTLTPYSMAKAEVTEGFYNKVMTGNYNGDCYKPVVGKTYYQAITFCNRLSIKLGLKRVYNVKKSNGDYYTDDEWLTITPPSTTDWYWKRVETDFTANGFHLPTECQWEFAARGGSTSETAWNYTYSGSNTVDNVAWYENNSSGVKQDGYSKSTNRLGIYGMSGNVYEMTNDYWVQTLPTGTFTNPTFNYNSSYVTTTNIQSRGGSFRNAAQLAEVKCRNWYHELNDDGATYVGFRICRNANY